MASDGGANVPQAAATVTSVDVDEGTLQLEGDYSVTTLTQTAGTVTDNHRKTSGNTITTANLRGGTYNAQGSNEVRTVATHESIGGRDSTGGWWRDDVYDAELPGGPYTVAVT